MYEFFIVIIDILREVSWKMDEYAKTGDWS